jgi:hypothetical protein
MTGGATLAALNGYAIAVNENQILYLFSTSAQVIAAIYGLTLTGFIFFRNELSREQSEDETLADAVESLKARYFALLMFITALVTLALLLANLAISHEGSGEPRLNTLILNAGQSAFVTSLFAVAYFVFDVISPHRIEVASRSLQSKADPDLATQTKGSLEEFLKNYNQIEALLEQVGQSYEADIAAGYPKRYPRRLSNARLAEVLLRGEKISQPLFHQLRELITLRNSIIHGAEPLVSQAVVLSSADVLQKLRSVLSGDHAEEP